MNFEINWFWISQKRIHCLRCMNSLCLRSHIIQTWFWLNLNFLPRWKKTLCLIDELRSLTLLHFTRCFIMLPFSKSGGCFDGIIKKVTSVPEHESTRYTISILNSGFLASDQNTKKILEEDTGMSSSVVRTCLREMHFQNLPTLPTCLRTYQKLGHA